MCYHGKHSLWKKQIENWTSQANFVLSFIPGLIQSLEIIIHRGCFPKFANGLNNKIGIFQKVYVWPSCSFVKMISWWENHFGKRTAESLIYFLNYAYFDMEPIRKFWETPSNWIEFNYKFKCTWIQTLTHSLYNG